MAKWHNLDIPFTQAELLVREEIKGGGGGGGGENETSQCDVCHAHLCVCGWGGGGMRHNNKK